MPKRSSRKQVECSTKCEHSVLESWYCGCYKSVCDTCRYNYQCTLCSKLLDINGFEFVPIGHKVHYKEGQLFYTSGDPVPRFLRTERKKLKTKNPRITKPERNTIMALSISFTKEDLLKSTQLQAAWYRFKVTDIAAKAGKSDPTSTTYHVQCKVASGNSAGVPVTLYLSEKQMDKVAAFIQCFVERIEPGASYDLEIAKDREFEGYAAFDDKMNWNSINDFRKVK